MPLKSFCDIAYLGPKRIRPSPLTTEQLPPIDFVVISHNHYDHLCSETVAKLGNGPRWFVPKGLHKWFSDAGVHNCEELGMVLLESFCPHKHIFTDFDITQTQGTRIFMHFCDRVVGICELERNASCQHAMVMFVRSHTPSFCIFLFSLLCLSRERYNWPIFPFWKIILVNTGPAVTWKTNVTHCGVAG